MNVASRCPYAQIDLIEIDLTDEQLAKIDTSSGVECAPADVGDLSLVGRNAVYRTINVEIYEHAVEMHRPLIDEAIRKKFPEGWNWQPTYEDAQDEKRVYPDGTSDIRVSRLGTEGIPMTGVPERCPDGGTCHHACGEGECFRVAFCEPFSSTYPDDKWPEDLVRADALARKRSEDVKPSHVPRRIQVETSSGFVISVVHLADGDVGLDVYNKLTNDSPPKQPLLTRVEADALRAALDRQDA